MRGIYVHIPFCVRKCGYCDFYSVPEEEEEALEAFPGQVVREIECLLRAFPREAEVMSDTVYFGGGTPTVLGPERLCRLLRAIRSRLPLEEGAEVTLEANPGTVRETDFLRLREGGFTRVSLGVQSFRPAALSALGRIHTAEEAKDAVRCANGAGFSSVSVDLIFGTPGQEEAQWREDLDLALALGPDHLSAYPLTPEPGTAIHEDLRRGALRLPSDDALDRMYGEARERLNAAGYRHYEISNFARAGKECRHNGKYWRRAEYLGLGPSAHGLLSPRETAPFGVRTSNPPSLREYLRRTGNREIPWEEAVPRTAQDAWMEHLVFGLRLAEGISLEEGERRFGPMPAGMREALDRLERSGALLRDGDSLRIPESLWFVSNEVLAPLV